MKKFFLIAISVIVFVSCGNNDGSRYINSNDIKYDSPKYDETVVDEVEIADDPDYDYNDDEIKDIQPQEDPTEVKMTKVMCSVCAGTGRCGVCGGGRVLYRSGDLIDCTNCNGSGCCQLCQGSGLMDQVVW